MTRSTDPVTVKSARKAHVCDWCGEAIEVGASYVRWRWFDSPNDTGSVALHPECHKAQRVNTDIDYDGFWSPHAFRRGCWCESGTEECDCGIGEEAKP